MEALPRVLDVANANLKFEHPISVALLKMKAILDVISSSPS